MAASRSFEANKQSLPAASRPFQRHIVIEQFQGFASQWQHANPITLAADTDLRVCNLDVFAVERQDFAGPQTMQEHQADDGQVPRRSETGPETGHLINRQGHNHAFGRLDPQLSQGWAWPPIAQPRLSPVPVLEARREQRWDIRKLTPHRTFDGSYATVDRSSSWRRILVDLKTNIVEERGFGQSLLSDVGSFVCSRPPTEE